jgi:hypothetical protein
MRRWPKSMQDRSDQDFNAGSKQFAILAMRLLVARGPFSCLGDTKAPKPPSLRLRWLRSWKSSIPVHRSSGEKLQLKPIRAVSASLAEGEGAARM